MSECTNDPHYLSFGLNCRTWGRCGDMIYLLAYWAVGNLIFSIFLQYLPIEVEKQNGAMS